MNKDMGTAIAYVRVSTSKQDLGPDAQRKAIELWAVREGIQIAAWHVDHGVSGATPAIERPALLGAIAALREAGATMLVAAKRDRLARDVEVAGSIDRLVRKEGATVRTADGMSDAAGSAGLIQRGMQDLFAAFEREVIRERTTAALAVKRAKGEKLGGRAPYGYEADAEGKLVPVEAEQAVIGEIRTLASSGASQRAIVASLAARGVVGRTGSPLQKTQIARILSA